jgi:TRAP-type mannitol/chloroaromatic compound transport system permease small subunit
MSVFSRRFWHHLLQLDILHCVAFSGRFRPNRTGQANKTRMKDAAIFKLNDWIGRTIAWLTLLMVLVTFAVAVLRYGFDWGSIALQESVLYLHSLVFMAGAAYTLRHDSHVRVDIFYSRFSRRKKAWVDLLGTLLLLLPFCLFILWSGWPYVRNAWSILESSREAGGLPLVFLLKSMIPLLAVLLMVQGVSVILHSLHTLRRTD